MEVQQLNVQRSAKATWIAPLAYVGALVAGVILISSGQASAAEASGYVAPLLVAYERVAHRRA